MYGYFIHSLYIFNQTQSIHQADFFFYISHKTIERSVFFFN